MVALTEREQFEAWVKTTEGHPFAGKFLDLMWLAWQARASQQAPEGWVPVPKEPTEAMIQAGCLSQSVEKFDSYRDWWNSHSSGISERIRGYLIKDYRAMISAAPTAGKGEGK